MSSNCENEVQSKYGSSPNVAVKLINKKQFDSADYFMNCELIKKDKSNSPQKSTPPYLRK